MRRIALLMCLALCLAPSGCAARPPRVPDASPALIQESVMGFITGFYGRQVEEVIRYSGYPFTSTMKPSWAPSWSGARCCLRFLPLGAALRLKSTPCNAWKNQP